MSGTRPRSRWRSGATIKDVAAAAGVSPMTVSRVLNKEPVVTVATREKVLKAVRDLDYRPNFSARSLAKARSFFIGLLYDNPSAGYISEFLNGAVARGKADRYHLVLEHCQAGIQSVFAEANVDGVILLPPVCDDIKVINTVDRLGVPYVRIGPDCAPDKGLQILTDDREAAASMVRYLIGLGHREIGFIKGHPNQGASRAREAGFRDVMAEAGLPIREDNVVQGYFSYQSGLAAAEVLMSKTHRPTVIFASNDDMAAAAVAQAHRFGLKVPTDLSVVGFDDTEIASAVWPALTTMRQPIREMAEAAVDRLIAMINNVDAAESPPNSSFVCELVQRDSSGQPRRG